MRNVHLNVHIVTIHLCVSEAESLKLNYRSDIRSITIA